MCDDSLMNTYRVTTPNGYSALNDLNDAAARHYSEMPGWTCVYVGPSRFITVNDDGQPI